MNPPSGSAMTGWSGRATQKTGDSPGTDCRLAWNEQPGNVVLLYAGAFARNQGGSRQAGWRRYGRADALADSVEELPDKIRKFII